MVPSRTRGAGKVICLLNIKTLIPRDECFDVSASPPVLDSYRTPHIPQNTANEPFVVLSNTPDEMPPDLNLEELRSGNAFVDGIWSAAHSIERRKEAANDSWCEEEDESLGDFALG